MKVEIINPEVLKDLYKNHGIFACACYDTPEKFAEKVGKTCEDSGHMSGGRCEYIKFRITDLDRGTSEQCLRHEIGTNIPYGYSDNYSFADYDELIKDVSPDQIVKNMASLRYIEKDGFTYTVPDEINKNRTTRNMFEILMCEIEKTRKSLKDILEKHGVDSKRANECANFVLPRATNSTLVIGFTPEALINFMHKRLCNRAQPEIRKVAILMRRAVNDINEEFAKELVPHCQHLLWCPEKKMSCGAFPTKEEVKEYIEIARKDS